jgi:uncharacterized protein (TIGR02466 family)
MNPNLIDVYNISATEDDLQKIIDNIYSIKQKEEGRIVSNVGGWQYELNDDDRKIIKPLEDTIDKIVPMYMEKCAPNTFAVTHELSNVWYNVNPIGTYNSPHQHAYNGLSGVFYLQPSDGNIYFVDPSGTSVCLMTNGILSEIEPKRGNLILFPANYIHGVHINNSEKDRISIAFNVNLMRENFNER